MTTDELCAWHAMRAGWKLNVWVEGDAQWENRFTKKAQYEDPFPATIDGAASAMPPGWKMTKGEHYWHVDGTKPNNRYKHATVPDTGDEIHDRYLMAKFAWEAMA